MDDRRWDLSIDGQEEDETLPRIDNVDWGDINKGVKKHKLDVSLVGLATGTDHIDAKIALTRKLIKIHKEHQKSGPSNNKELLPEKVLDRLTYHMIAACAENAAIPNILLRLLSLRMKLPHRTKKGIQDPIAHRKLLHFVVENPGIGKKKAANAVGIKESTAKKWMGDPEFKSFVEYIRNHSLKRAKKHGIKGVK